MDDDSQSEEAALAEYSAAHDAYLHYDNFPWQVGGVFVVGVFFFWARMLDSSPPKGVATLVASVLVTLIMSAWLLRCAHNRQIYIFILHRIHEIEARFKMRQHLRFKSGLYRMDDPRGHILNSFFYVVVCLGGPILSVLVSEELLPALVNGLLVIAVVWQADRMGRRAYDLVDRLEKGTKDAKCEGATTS